MTAPRLSTVLPGSRGRIGVIQPAPGLMLEAEWYGVMPAGVAFPVTRIPLGGGTPADYRVMGEHGPAAAAILANARSDAIAYACGVGSLYEGPAAEARYCDGLSRAAGGRPVVGMAAASLAAIAHLRATRVAFVTPYADPVNDLVRRYLEEAGLKVAAVHRFDVESPVAAAGLSSEAVASAVAALHAAAPEADLIWLPCSNVPTLGLIARLEAETGIPVVSSNLALLWRMLALIGVDARPVEARLFAPAMPRPASPHRHAAPA